MRYNQIRAFHQVASHGGFSRAAEHTGQSQPALSDQVRRLEQDYDVLLFHRDGRRIRITEAGEALFRITKRYFGIEQEIEEHLNHSRGAIQGHLRIMADSAIHVLPILGAFRRRHPKVIVQIQAGNSAQVLEALRTYDVEIGVLGSFDPVPDMDIINLGAAPVVAISGEGPWREVPDRLDFKTLARYPLVFREKGSKTRQCIEAEAYRQRVVLAPVLEVAGREAMREVVASGLGIGFISEAEIGHDPRIRVHRLEGPGLEMTESLINLSARRDLPLIRAFVLEASSPATGPGDEGLPARA